MPYDPNFPATNEELVSPSFRAQFNGLKDLIDAIVPGTISAVFIDAITAVGPNDPASASASLVGTELHLTFAIPRGQDGAPGEVTAESQATAIAGAVAGSSANSNAVATLDTPFADADAETLRGAFNGLVLALRRL